MSDQRFEFTKENIDLYLKEVAKEYRRQVGKNMPAELTLIGGASVLINYGFRKMTTDIDAMIHAASAMKDAINRVGDKYELPNGWLNADFTKTDSYSSELAQYSVYYKTFSNVLEVRTIAAEYLIAMKLRSGRKYKNDLSDILGILAEHEKRGTPITFEQIREAAARLYGSWDAIPVDSQSFINDAMKNGSFEDLYVQIQNTELETKNLLIKFEKDYPGLARKSNIDEIIDALKKKVT